MPWSTCRGTSTTWCQWSRRPADRRNVSAALPTVRRPCPRDDPQPAGHHTGAARPAAVRGHPGAPAGRTTIRAVAATTPSACRPRCGPASSARGRPGRAARVHLTLRPELLSWGLSGRTCAHTTGPRTGPGVREEPGSTEAERLGGGLQQNSQVQQGCPVVDVPDINRDPLGQLNDRRPETCASPVFSGGPRAGGAARQHVDQVGHFVQRSRPQPPAHPGDSRVVLLVQRYPGALWCGAVLERRSVSCTKVRPSRPTAAAG
jgi:hypothetical protein